MTPEQKIAAGAAIVCMIVPTLGELSVAVAAGGVAGVVLLVVAEEALSTGIVWLATGVAEKAAKHRPHHHRRTHKHRHHRLRLAPVGQTLAQNRLQIPV
jgi:hypothetical protein